MSEQISYDRVKEQVEKELLPFISAAQNQYIEMPKLSFEKGTLQVTFTIPPINERTIVNVLNLMKSHLENVRVHSFGEGYYAFQALNSNLFKTENILDNFKVELYGLTSNFRVDITKKGNLNQEEINLSVEIFKSFYNIAADNPFEILTRMGASVYLENGALDWSYIAGYEDVKQRIRESIIMPLAHPEIYDSVAKLTRRTFESNRPKAILFEGAPGVGKTTIARIIAGEAKTPLVYVPIESIMSKWYGQSSQNLSRIFDACEMIGGSILFFDEIDSLAGSRDQNMFEATRRVLSVLLRRLDGVDAVTNTITIGATNRKNDLDHALISRFDQTIFFPLPDQKERAAIFANYARHLSEDELMSISSLCEGVSGRNIKDICEYTERRWARKIILQKLESSPPSVEYYKSSINLWKNEREDKL